MSHPSQLRAFLSESNPQSLEEMTASSNAAINIRYKELLKIRET
jgi:hypothetical protein